MSRFLATGFLSLFLLLPLQCFSWNAVGHMVVARIAYQSLKPAVKKEVDNLLSYFKEEYPEMKSFLTLAYWPDTLRNQKINSYTRWHYIDLPFTNDNTPLVDTIMSDNVVWAVDNVSVVVKNPRANPYERVRFLSFLVHFVGDIHQPLHTTTLISSAHPTGDKGGNLYYVYYRNRRMKLHELWDNGFGTFETDATEENIVELAKRIMAFHPRTQFGSDVYSLSPEEWAKEGFSLSKKFVYETAEEEPLSDEYIKAAQENIESEVALAGYRLAEMLNQSFV